MELLPEKENILNFHSGPRTNYLLVTMVLISIILAYLIRVYRLKLAQFTTTTSKLTIVGQG